MKDALGDRMKKFYENIFRYFLPRRTYTIIRIDGKAFHTYTNGLDRPFDKGLTTDMDLTAQYLCEEIQGAKMAFVQSDEISVLVTDFDKLETSAWYDNNLQKMCSVSASLATARFNYQRFQRYFDRHSSGVNISEHFESDVDLEVVRDDISSMINYLPSNPKLAMFDSRVFQIPTKSEVMNYFIWRQQDTTKNSISSVAYSLYPHKELEGKNGNEKQEMIFQKGINWDKYDPKLKRGRIIVKETYDKNGVNRTRWSSQAPPIFTVDKEFLENLIPTNE